MSRSIMSLSRSTRPLSLDAQRLAGPPQAARLRVRTACAAVPTLALRAALSSGRHPGREHGCSVRLHRMGEERQVRLVAFQHVVDHLLTREPHSISRSTNKSLIGLNIS